MKKGIIYLTLFFFGNIFSSFLYAQSTLGLQEKCAEGAKKFFFEHLSSYGGTWGHFSDEKEWGWNRFTSHYNKRLDECFIRIDYHFSRKDTTKEKDISGSDVWNAFEETFLAGYSAPPFMRCEVREQTCNSQYEFENLLRPYMEE